MVIRRPPPPPNSDLYSRAQHLQAELRDEGHPLANQMQVLLARGEWSVLSAIVDAHVGVATKESAMGEAIDRLHRDITSTAVRSLASVDATALHAVDRTTQGDSYEAQAAQDTADLIAEMLPIFHGIADDIVQIVHHGQEHQVHRAAGAIEDRTTALGQMRRDWIAIAIALIGAMLAVLALVTEGKALRFGCPLQRTRRADVSLVAGRCHDAGAPSNSNPMS